MTDSYHLKDIERRLGEEVDTAELGVQLSEHGRRIYVHGAVASEGTRRSILRRVEELCPGREVVDELTCAEETLSDPPRSSEELR